MLENWAVFLQLTAEPVFEMDGQTLVVRSPMWEFGRSHAGQRYSGYALNVDEIVRAEQGWRFARRIWHPLLMNQADIPGTIVPLPTDLRS